MSQDVQYNVKDTQGNIYGPASAQMLRDWVREGRIVRGMTIAPEGTDNWVEVSVHPALVDLFGGTAMPVATPVATPVAAAPAPTPTAAVPMTAEVVDPIPSTTPTAMMVPTNTPVVRAGSPGSVSAQRASMAHGAGPHVNIPAAIGFGAGIIGLLSTCGVCCCGVWGGVGSTLLALVAVAAGAFGFLQIRKAPGHYVAGWLAFGAVIAGVVTLIIAILGSIIYELNLHYHWFN